MLLMLLACTQSSTEYSDVVEPLRGNREMPELDTGEPIRPPEDSGDPDDGVEIPKVVLNEIMSNNRSFADPWNEMSDWIEIYNGTDQPVALSSIMLSDSSEEAWIGGSGAIDPGGYNIVYANQSLQEMLSKAEADIRKDLPQFSAAKVIGTNIDVFHKKPSHQRGMLDRLSAVHRTKLEIGGRSFDLIVNPIKDDAG
jgi:hypothetical protein